MDIPLNKWQYSFQMKAAELLANQLATPSDRHSNMGPRNQAKVKVKLLPISTYLAMIHKVIRLRSRCKWEGHLNQRAYNSRSLAYLQTMADNREGCRASTGLNTMRLNTMRQNGNHFADSIFIRIFSKVKFGNLIKIPQDFVFIKWGQASIG